MQQQEEGVSYHDSIHPTPFESLNFHPNFSSPDADVVLAAKDAKIYFRIHLHTLKTTSGFFRTTYSLPQTSNTEDILYLDEDADILAHLFRMICGLPFARIETHDLLESLLYAAEKYDMPGPMSIMRIYILTPDLESDPIRLYAFASRYDWKEEARILSTKTLCLNIYEEKHRSSLQRLSANALLELVLLHRLRRDGLKECLDGPPFVSGDASRCNNCQAPINYSTWKELKYRIFSEMDHRPLGDTVVDSGLSTWPEAMACWRAACSNEGCKRLLYDRTETVRVIRECMDKMPKTIT